MRVPRRSSCVQRAPVPEFRPSFMNRKYRTCSWVVFSARTILALALIAAFACTVIPLASASAGNVCQLECCAGHATHAAGSCMNGTCHAAIRIQKSSTGRAATSAPADELCGLTSVAKRLQVTTIPLGPNSSPDSQHSFSTVGQHCEPNCSSCSGSSHSFKEKTTAARAGNARPLVALWFVNSRPALLPNALTREYSPRGPPSRFLV